MSAKTNQQANALLTLYSSLYTKRYKTAPTMINRYRDKWGMVDVIESVGYDRAKELLEYYLGTSRATHPLQWFFYNFDTIDKTMEDEKADGNERRKVMLETKKRAEEWIEQQRSKSNHGGLPE